MSFKELLKLELKNKIDKKDLDFLPSGFQAIGDICILNLKPELVKYKKIIGEKVLDLFYKRFKTICNKTGIITGEFREPQIEIIAGDKNTEAVVKENNCIYKFDVRKIMFAKGNINERVRIASQVKRNEVIVDMFAGIGYFTIGIAKLGRPKKIYSLEKNPISFKYLNENLKLNHIRDRVEAINGDNKKIVPELVEKGVKADRIVMGYLPPPKEFLDNAMLVAKKGTILHYEDILRVGKEKEDSEKAMKLIQEAAKKKKLKAKLVSLNRVKGYGPKTEHYVLDVKIS